MNYTYAFLLTAAVACGCDDTTQPRTDGVPVVPSSAETSDGNAIDRNATDRSDTEKTPFDQYENKADVDITAQIRSRVVDTDMSVSAQNAKIITQNGKVTLRGEVKSETEKQHVETIALAVAGEGNVDNQLEIDQD
ncbi:MAG: BON domain-containing protein [Planctomycetaceae bacterium]|nr:MAG: BON domain-containing protein [Planctomycetaceae bacterium]